MSTLYTIKAFLGEEKAMGKARVCDRCGRVFSNTYDNDWEMEEYPRKVKYGYDYGKKTIYVSRDLCGECSADFSKFMNEKSHK